MRMLVSSVVIFDEHGHYAELVVPGIPSKREDIETADGYSDFAQEFSEKTLVSAKVQTYYYSEGEEGLRDYPDLIARIHRDYRFLEEHCEPGIASEFKFWTE